MNVGREKQLTLARQETLVGYILTSAVISNKQITTCHNKEKYEDVVFRRSTYYDLPAWIWYKCPRPRRRWGCRERSVRVCRWGQDPASGHIQRWPFISWYTSVLNYRQQGQRPTCLTTPYRSRARFSPPYTAHLLPSS